MLITYLQLFLFYTLIMQFYFLPDNSMLISFGILCMLHAYIYLMYFQIMLFQNLHSDNWYLVMFQIITLITPTMRWLKMPWRKWRLRSQMPWSWRRKNRTTQESHCKRMICTTSSGDWTSNWVLLNPFTTHDFI